SRPRTTTVGLGTEVQRGPHRVERRTHPGHDQVRSRARRPPGPDDPARRADGAPQAGAEPADGEAEGTAQPERRIEGGDERHRRAARRLAEGQDPEVREVGEVCTLREAPRTAPAVVMTDGTARESPEVPRDPRGRAGRARLAEGRRRGAGRGEGPRGPVAQGSRGRPQAVRRKDRADRPPRGHDPWTPIAGEGTRVREHGRGTRDEESLEGTRRRAQGIAL